MRWSEVCKPRDQGGLGVTSLKIRTESYFSSDDGEKCMKEIVFGIN